MLPKSITDKVRNDIIAYKQEHGLSDEALAQKVGVFQGQISKWRTGDSRPLTKSIEKLVKAGVTDIKLPELLRSQAVQTKLIHADDGNRIPRVYKKRVHVPPIVANQIKLLIGDYMAQLEQPKTYSEFQEQEQEFIRKVYYLCNQ
jgi:transcriptional regulator with XRE-family HTH domain